MSRGKLGMYLATRREPQSYLNDTGRRRGYTTPKPHPKGRLLEWPIEDSLPVMSWSLPQGPQEGPAVLCVPVTPFNRTLGSDMMTNQQPRANVVARFCGTYSYIHTCTGPHTLSTDKLALI
jgi:hypothetical protein